MNGKSIFVAADYYVSDLGSCGKGINSTTVFYTGGFTRAVLYLWKLQW